MTVHPSMRSGTAETVQTLPEIDKSRPYLRTGDQGWPELVFPVREPLGRQYFERLAAHKDHLRVIRAGLDALDSGSLDTPQLGSEGSA